MVKRVGVGATAASAVIFSVVLISNLALFVGSQDRASLYAQSDAEDLLAGEAATLTGSTATNLLSEVQSIVALGPMDCFTAARDLEVAIGSLVDEQRSGTLTVRATSYEAPDLYSADDLSMLSPFNGSVSGDLNVGLSFTESSRMPVAGVTFDRNETHLAHLPVRWDSALQDCIGAVEAVVSAVSASHVSNCTVGMVGPRMAAAASGPEDSAAADGFTFGVDYSIAGETPCTVSFRISVGQPAVDGPAGEFNLLLEGRGSASFA